MKIKIVRNSEELEFKLFDADMENLTDCADRLLYNIRKIGFPKAVSVIQDEKTKSVKVICVGNQKKLDKIYEFVQENIIRKPKKAGL